MINEFVWIWQSFPANMGEGKGGETFPASVSCNKGLAVFWFSLSVKTEKVSQVIEIGTGIQIWCENPTAGRWSCREKTQSSMEFLSSKKTGWMRGRDDSSIYLFLMRGEIREEMSLKAIRLSLTIICVLLAVNARDTVKKWSVLRLNHVWQSLLSLGVM